MRQKPSQIGNDLWELVSQSRLANPRHKCSPLAQANGLRVELGRQRYRGSMGTLVWRRSKVERIASPPGANVT